MLADAGKPLNREHWTIHASLCLSFPSPPPDDNSKFDIVSSLRRAWQVLRLQHPALGATINESDGEVPRLTVALRDIDAWADTTFTVIHDCHSAIELFSSLHSTPTATCYWIPSSSELVIRSSHWRIDGVGMAMLCHDYMTALASTMRHDRQLGSSVFSERISADTPSYELESPLEILARGSARLHSSPIENPLPLKEEPMTEENENPILGSLADALVSEFLRGTPSIGLPTRPWPPSAGEPMSKEASTTAVPGPSQTVFRKLDPTSTARVRQWCRTRGMKLASAVHAAIVRVTATFPQHPLSSGCYAAFVPVDLRSVLDASVTRKDASQNRNKTAGLYFSGLPVRVDSAVAATGGEGPGGHVDKRKGFDAVARDLDAVYGCDLLRFRESPDHSTLGKATDSKAESSEEQKYISLLDLAEPYVQRTTRLFDAPVPEGFPPVQTPDLSTLGRVETYLQNQYGSPEHGAVEVSKFWFGTEMLNRSVQFHTWGWRDEFHLGACFNTRFYEKEFVEDVVRKVVEEVLAECSI